MFCPKGPSVLADPNNPGSLSVSGLDRDNLVLRVQTNLSDGYVDLTFLSGVTVRVSGTQPEFIRVPAASTGVSYSVGGNASVRTSLALGEDF